jgi:hypothetical protein
MQLYTISDLESLILASSEEITNYLKSQCVVEIDGYLRLLSQVSLKQTTRALLDTIIENSLSLKTVSFEQCRQLLNPVDETILLHTFKSLGQFSDDTDAWHLDADKVARASACSIFDEANATVTRPFCIFVLCGSLLVNGQVIEKQDFLSAWSLRTPLKDTPSESLLSGIAVIDEPDTSHGSTHNSTRIVRYRYLPVSSLSKELPVSKPTMMFCFDFPTVL